jgi:hypothetical protein
MAKAVDVPAPVNKGSLSPGNRDILATHRSSDQPSEQQAAQERDNRQGERSWPMASSMCT